jgi:hypothetical protein
MTRYTPNSLMPVLFFKLLNIFISQAYLFACFYFRVSLTTLAGCCKIPADKKNDFFPDDRHIFKTIQLVCRKF